MQYSAVHFICVAQQAVKQIHIELNCAHTKKRTAKTKPNVYRFVENSYNKPLLTTANVQERRSVAREIS